MDKSNHNPQIQLKPEREYRRFETFEVRAIDNQGDQNSGKYVEGYALTFEQPTVLYEHDGIQYMEQIARGALATSDMKDVIFNYDHGGKVMARTRNKTLELIIDDKGLFIRARLDGTEEGRRLYEEIKGGYIDKMSFAFSTSASEYNKDTRTRTITAIKRIYDVSAVSIPAYDTTSLQARSFFELERTKEQKVLESAELRKKLLLLTYL